MDIHFARASVAIILFTYFYCQAQMFYALAPTCARPKFVYLRFFGCKNKNAGAFGFTFCTTNVRDLLIPSRNCIYIKGDKIKLANDDGTDYDGNIKNTTGNSGKSGEKCFCLSVCVDVCQCVCL